MIAAIFLLAANLGQMGETFPIVEKENVDWITENMPSPDWISAFNRPQPVSGIEKAAKRNSFLHDPTDETFNPLDLVPLPNEMIFIDGDDEDQVAWARRQKKNALWMLVSGSPMQLGEREHREVFFDQWGFWCEKLGIQHVPAHIFQEGKQIRVEEIPVRKNGEEQ